MRRITRLGRRRCLRTHDGAWRAAIVAHAIAIAGVLLGIAALAAGAGPTTPLNVAYHRAILSLLIVGAIVLASSPGRRALLLDR